MPETDTPTPLHDPKIVEGKLELEGSGMLGPANEVAQQEEQKFEGSQVLIAVPQKLDNGQVALVIVGQAQIIQGVRLAADELKLGD